MGWCHEFGPEIGGGCDHPMRAGSSSCSCSKCGVVCHGRFVGCREVWGRGPRRVKVFRQDRPAGPTTRVVRSRARGGPPAAPLAEAVTALDADIRRLREAVDLAEVTERLDEVEGAVGQLVEELHRPRSSRWLGLFRDGYDDGRAAKAARRARERY